MECGKIVPTDLQNKSARQEKEKFHMSVGKLSYIRKEKPPCTAGVGGGVLL